MLSATNRSTWIVLLAVAVATQLGAGAIGRAQEPPGYYDTVDLTNSDTAHQSLHAIIHDHTRIRYTQDPYPDTWDVLNLADEHPTDDTRILDVYRNESYLKIPGGIGPYNREHVWPKSYGFPDNNLSNYPYTDCHHLMLSDAGYNSARKNKPFRFCIDPTCREKPTELNDGRGGGSGVYPGNSNWALGDETDGTWETWGGRRGDVARAIFYMAVRYDGGTHGVTGSPEPDLKLTDIESDIDESDTESNEPEAYMGMYSDLLDWHYADPVDAYEIVRNEVVYLFQGNRNPFIDHPEWVACVFEDHCSPDTTPPAAPTGLVATGGDASITLTWNANTESDLAGYHLLRSTTSGGPYVRVYGPLIIGTTATDTGLVNGTTYFYVLRAVDTWSNASADSGEASATPQGGGPGPGQLVLSEVFYDASGPPDDGLEWVELYNSGPTPLDLSSYSLGNGGTSYAYSKVQLSGNIAPGATFVVGGPTSSGANANPTYDLVVNFSPDFQNSGATADGVALFDVPTHQSDGAVPIDAVIYGGANTNGLIDETGVANPPEVGDAPAGSSIERITLAGAWQVQASPSPNTTSLPPPDVCTAADGENLALYDDTVPDVRSYEACDTIAVGPNYEVTAPGGNLTLRAGRAVRLESGTSIEAGCHLTVEIDESLQVPP